MYNRSLIPPKLLMPKEVLGSDVTKWMDYKKDVEGWAEAMTAGMRGILQAIAKAPDGTRIDAIFMEKFRNQVEAEGTRFEKLDWVRKGLYEALRQMTKERARAVVESSGYDGFEAWHRLCIHFQPNADAQAAALGGG